MAKKAKKKTPQKPEIDVSHQIAASIHPVNTADEIKSEFKTYGFSVIKERALPDIRDGLKPVQRAILYEMVKSKITSDKKPTKVARITGAVIGFWHPHGDKAVEDALALMAVPWKNSMPVITIKGNKGSVYGDPHAEGRYIEAKLSPTGDAYGHNLKKGIVEYVPNFDATLEQPSVMPAQLPYLIINGGEGIAVGVASSIPTHNPIEVVNALISYIQNTKQSVEDLLELMPGPDFPTNGEITNKSDLAEIYKNGVGKIRVRGRMKYDKKTNIIHIYEIPPTAAGSIDKLVSEIALASLPNGKNPPKITGIKKVLDHSGKNGIDISIYLNKSANAENVMNDIYAKTRLETTLKYNFMALNNKRVKRYGLIQYFKEYTSFLHQITTNEYIIEKQNAEKRMEVIKGLLIMQQFIDEVIASARVATNKAELREVLETGKVLKGVPKIHHKNIKTFKFSEVQSEHISTLPIYRLTKMDSNALIDEGKELQKLIANADGIINDVAKRKRLIVKRLKAEIKLMDATEYARKTDIIDIEPTKAVVIETPESPLYVGIDKYQYVRIEEKPFETSKETTNKSRLGFIDNNGICWNVHLENTPLTTDNGVFAKQLINNDETIVGMTTAISDTELHYGLFIYKDGNMKLTDMRKFQTKTKATKVASGKTPVPLMMMVDVPKDAVGVTINDVAYRLDEFSVNGLSGRGKHMTNEYDDNSVINIDFIQDESLLAKATPKSSGRKAGKSSAAGVAYFDGTDTLTFDWSESEPTRESLFAIPYPELLKSTLIVVHDDGTAKLIKGEQFKVATKRSAIQSDKKGCTSIYIGKVPETLLATYDDGTMKRVETKLISTQGKAGGGVRAFYTTKHKLTKVEDGTNSELECVSLATQPK